MPEHRPSLKPIPWEPRFDRLLARDTRAQAIADGDLVDVSPAAFHAGFDWPVALTRAVWNDCVAWSDEDSERQTDQNADERLWNVLMMAWVKVRVSPDARFGEPLPFGLRRIPRRGRCRRPRLTTLHLLSGYGDDYQPALTIMFRKEAQHDV